MSLLRFLVGGVLPYLAVIVFLAAMSYRIWKWKKLPAPPMTLFPAPSPGRGSTAVRTLKEALLFPGLFRSDRSLWAFSWTFHLVLAVIFVAHLRVATNVDTVLYGMGMSEAGLQGLSEGAGGAAGVIVLLAAIVLLLRRLVIPRVRAITSVADLLALVLVGVVLITGNMLRFGAEHFDLTLTREYFVRLATFHDPGGAQVLQNNVYLAHMGMALLLVMYIPFSKILHLGGIFFTHHMIRRH